MLQVSCFVSKMFHYMKDIYRLPSTMRQVNRMYIAVGVLSSIALLSLTLFLYRHYVCLCPSETGTVMDWLL